mgnify:CR=1 FL=1
MKKERFLRVFRCVIRTFSITAQQPVRISTSGQALVKLGPLLNKMVKTGSESVNKRLCYRRPVCDHPNFRRLFIANDAATIAQRHAAGYYYSLLKGAVLA